MCFPEALGTGDVQTLQCTNSKGEDVREVEVLKGRHMCLPNWQAWHKDRSALVQVMCLFWRSDATTVRAGWPRRWCHREVEAARRVRVVAGTATVMVYKLPSLLQRKITRRVLRSFTENQRHQILWNYCREWIVKQKEDCKLGMEPQEHCSKKIVMLWWEGQTDHQTW